MTSVKWHGETLVIVTDVGELRLSAAKVGEFLDALLDEVCLDCAGPLHPADGPATPTIN